MVQPELLAPAGDWECLRAALANGANAVYFGLGDFNARRRATNFTEGELPGVIACIHHHNAKAYVALNTLIFSQELPLAAEYAMAVAAAGADAAIVQDLGLACLIRRLAPTLEIHASTQMTQTEAMGIELLRSLGFGRVILARELSTQEIERIRRVTPMPLEAFVHGAICISYSGQCLASESLWGRSANRGLCAQACRLPYELVVDGQARDSDGRKYLLSAQDLSALERIGDLVSLGIAGFKIEGRLKSAQYVAASSQVYRKALDAAARGKLFSPSSREQEELELSFSRGQSCGFFDGVDNQRLVHGRFPKKRGLFVGTVVGKTRRGILVETAIGPSKRPLTEEKRPGVRRPGKPTSSVSARREVALKPGDGVVFDQGRPEQQEQGGRVFTVRPASGESRMNGPGPGAVVELTFNRVDVDITSVRSGSKVWKTDDPVFRRGLVRRRGGGAIPRAASLSVRVEGHPGGSLTIKLSDENGHDAVVSWEGPLRPAERHPLTTALISEQFGRLGGTPFELTSVELLELGSRTESIPVLAPKSVLNELRRQGVKALVDVREAARRHSVADGNALSTLREELGRYFAEDWPRLVGSSDVERETSVNVLVRTAEQLQATLDWASTSRAGVATAICGDFTETGLMADAVRRCRASGCRIALATPRVLMPGEAGALEAIASLAPDWVLIRNLCALAYFRREHPDLLLVGDQSLNTANEVAAFVYAREGVRRLTPGYDLRWRQLKDMLAYVPSAFVEVVLHQHVPMFHTRHCLYAANLSGATDCRACDRPCESRRLQLRDRRGKDHSVLVDGMGRNTVFNAAVQTAVNLIPEMIRIGLGRFRVEMLHERRDDVGRLLAVYAAVLSGEMEATAGLRRLRGVVRPPGRLATLAIE